MALAARPPPHPPPAFWSSVSPPNTFQALDLRPPPPTRHCCDPAPAARRRRRWQPPPAGTPDPSRLSRPPDAAFPSRFEILASRGAERNPPPRRSWAHLWLGRWAAASSKRPGSGQDLTSSSPLFLDFCSSFRAQRRERDRSPAAVTSWTRTSAGAGRPPAESLRSEQFFPSPLPCGLDRGGGGAPRPARLHAPANGTRGEDQSSSGSEKGTGTPPPPPHSPSRLSPWPQTGRCADPPKPEQRLFGQRSSSRFPHGGSQATAGRVEELPGAPP